MLRKYDYYDRSKLLVSYDYNKKLLPNTGRPVEQLRYSKIIGSHMYVMSCTRPDIAFVVGMLSRFTSNPGKLHWDVVQRLMRYLKGTTDIWQVVAKPGDSWMWKQLIRTRDKAMALCGGENNLKLLISSCCKNSKLRISAIYNALLHSTNEVQWTKVVWGRLNIPKHSFISCLVFQDRLLTKDRLYRRGIINSNLCSLCDGACSESRNHLFFECAFSCEVWNSIMDWMDFNWRACHWHHVLEWFTVRQRGKGLKQLLKNLALTATIYYIWRERNVRIFQQKYRSTTQLIREIETDIWITILNNPLAR
ncbi:uncharacterized protein LOC109833912 [Asparagus officinalis]|uniref:uncharacterized protein LOC109833912 n=1 Tax=Asparagus officinalis TaxID=4686 RepID=UPI00098DFDDC|nr:uncharacterized protein LOC109833912 [Asparagus officinalis]